MTVDSTASIMKELKSTIRPMTLVILLKVYIELATSEIVIRPRDTEAVIGHKTYLNCSTSYTSKDAEWYYHKPEDLDKSLYIYEKGKLQGAYKSRAIVEKYNDTNSSVAFNLVIYSVNVSDAGRYVCHENDGLDQHSSAELIVLEALPVCKVLDNEEGFTGPNNCVLEKEEILLSCETKYHGNIPPIFQWENDEMELVKDGVQQLNDTENITSQLRLSSDSVRIQSSYRCQTTRSAFEQQSCITAPRDIKIIYAFNDFSILQMSVGDNATCSPNSSQPCSYKWYHDGHSSVVSNNSKVTFKFPGLYRCEAECTFKKKLCPVISGQIQVSNRDPSNQKRLEKSPDTTAVSILSGGNSDSSHWKIALTVTLLLLAGIVVVLVVRSVGQRRRNTKLDGREDIPRTLQEEEEPFGTTIGGAAQE